MRIEVLEEKAADLEGYALIRMSFEVRQVLDVAVLNEGLAELAAEQLWDESFRQSSEQLSKLAGQALNEHRKGRTRPLDPEKL